MLFKYLWLWSLPSKHKYVVLAYLAGYRVHSLIIMKPSEWSYPKGLLRDIYYEFMSMYITNSIYYLGSTKSSHIKHSIFYLNADFQ